MLGLNDVAFWKRPITSFGGFLEALERPKFWSGRPIPTAENSPMDVTEQVSVGTAETSGEETERNGDFMGFTEISLDLLGFVGIPANRLT